jgi:hypothetical protein
LADESRPSPLSQNGVLRFNAALGRPIVTATAGVPGRRWIALVAAAAIVAHAFGMGVLGPRMAAASQIAAAVVTPGAAEDCPHHAQVAADLAAAGHHGAGAAGQEHSPEKHPPSCEACPLGQSGMALAPPPAAPVAGSVVHVDPPAVATRSLLVEAWRHRNPPARAPPGRAAA